jgi:hypothetical protein
MILEPVKHNLRKMEIFMKESKLVLLLGILSVLIPIIGVFLGLAAIGLGIKAKVVPKTKSKVNGRIQIRIGMVLGVISLVLTVVGLFFFLPMFLIL